MTKRTTTFMQEGLAFGAALVVFSTGATLASMVYRRIIAWTA